MPESLSALAPGRRAGPLAAPHLVPLAGEWALWRDVAVRTAGFPVSGLDIFGARDEQAGLRAVARDPMFQTAVTWQNRAAMANAVAKVAAGETVTARDGSWQAPLAHLLWLPILIAGAHAYQPFPADGHSARITIGRTVWQRETWRIRPAQGPARPEDAAGWARGHGLPRRVFALVPGELKPLYIDFNSPVLTRILVPPAPPGHHRLPRPAGPVHRDAPRAGRLLADRPGRPPLHQRTAPGRRRPGPHSGQKTGTPPLTRLTG